MAEPEAQERRKYASLAWKGALAIAGSALTLWWAFHDVDLSQVGEELADSDFTVLGLFFAAHLALHFLRIARWGLLVKPLGAISNRKIFSAAALGFPATFFLPLRLGELARPVIVSRAGIPFGSAMASIVVERIADGIANLAFFFVTLNLMSTTGSFGDELRPIAIGALVIFGSAFVCLVLTCIAREPAFRLLRRIGTPISATVTDKVLALLDTFIAGAMVLRQPSRLFAFLGLTLVYWSSAGLLAWYLAISYVPGLSILSGWFITGVGTFMIMIPAAPGFAGTLEAGFKMGMAPFGVGSDDAAVVALAFHAVQLLLMAVSAGLGFLTAGGKTVAPARVPVENGDRV